jgi:uncharacterized membrane protein (DUF2068 family)
MMNARPMAVSVAAVLLVLANLLNSPWPWFALLPGSEEAPAVVVYTGIVLGVLGIVAGVGLWLTKPWSYWAAIIISVINILLNGFGIFMVPTAALQAFIAAQTVGFILAIVLVVIPTSRRALTASS